MNLRKQIKQAWQAMAVADLGETSDPIEMSRRLESPKSDLDEASQALPLPGVVRLPDVPRLIVLMAKDALLPAAVDYVREAAPRLQADVALLTPDSAPPDNPELLADFKSDGTALLTHRIVGHFEAGIRRFVRQHPQTIFVVMADLVFPHQGLPMLSIPVVVVTEHAMARQGGAL